MSDFITVTLPIRVNFLFEQVLIIRLTFFMTLSRFWSQISNTSGEKITPHILRGFCSQSILKSLQIVLSALHIDPIHKALVLSRLTFKPDI